MVNTSKLYELLNDSKLDELKEALLNNMREENAKQSDKKNELKTIKSIIKSAPDHMKGYSKTIDERYCFIDGHRLVISENDYMYSEIEKPFKVESLLNTTNYNKTFTVDIDDLKLFVKTHKKADKAPYIIITDTDLKIGFNPYFLLDSIIFSGTNEFYYYNEKSSVYQFNDDKIVSLVLPIRITSEV